RPASTNSAVSCSAAGARYRAQPGSRPLGDLAQHDHSFRCHLQRHLDARVVHFSHVRMIGVAIAARRHAALRAGRCHLQAVAFVPPDAVGWSRPRDDIEGLRMRVKLYKGPLIRGKAHVLAFGALAGAASVSNWHATRKGSTLRTRSTIAANR